jgi:glycerol-3-phosphate dehydrogenase
VLAGAARAACEDGRVIAREQAMAALEGEAFDVVVVGGGITGAGVALDAASRGYSVALIERADYASGTSSRSSKLVHGGLRYLQQFDLGLVREALLERQLMVKLAPHLVRPLPIIVAATGGARLDRLVGVGLNLYDVMSVERGRRRRASGDAWSPDRHRTIGAAEVVEALPALAAAEPTAGYLFYDCQTDDSRLVLTVLGEAERFGAVCANRVSACALLEERGRVTGVRARDELGGAELTLRASHVVNATGVWADALRPQAPAPDAVPVIRPSRGTHVIFSEAALPLRAGAIVPAGGGRTIFALPWLGRTLVGTTDNDYEGGLEHVQPPGEDLEYLLAAVNGFFGVSLGRGDIAGAFAGVRPLISASADAKSSVDISRKAELYEPADGLVTITGGKLTTWRRMAKMTVDRLVERDARSAPCRTQEIPLGQAIDADELPRVAGVQDAAYPALAARYGHAAHEVLRLAAARPQLAAAIVPGLPDLLAEVVVALRAEQAQSLGDVLLRRTRLGLLAAREACSPVVLERLAQTAADELGWDAARRAAEIDAAAREAVSEGLVVDRAAA